MENQVQSLVFVDGEWVSRSADVYQIIARNQQQEDAAMRETNTNLHPEIPSLGILSRTVIETPFNSFILPANIRHRSLNDVVFIGEQSLQLKEICDYGHLRPIATKSDFKGKILAARVFGDPRKVEQSPDLQHTTVHRVKRHATAEDDDTLPPDILVLTLSSRTLMFLWASQTQKAPATFQQKTVRLPGGRSRFDQPGPYLAIDPKCRAIAVAAQEGSFVLYKTKTPIAWRNESRDGSDGLPIIDEAIIPIEGRIMHMEFLSSGGMRDDSHVVLVFILVHNGKTKVASYDWDSRFVMNDSTARKERSNINFHDRNPSLLIPLSRKPDFLLVCDEHISFYERVLSGPSNAIATCISDRILRPRRPGDSKYRPRWVQWSRATRNPDFATEVFYIAREDGVVIYVEQQHYSNGVDITEAGVWRYPIDTAFACLNIDNSEYSQAYPDVLISGGVGTDGLLCKVGDWPKEYSYTKPPSEMHAFSDIESIPSWAPLADMLVTELPGLRNPYERKRAGIFVTSGKAPEGEISELRRGLKAGIEGSFPEMTGCTGLWILDHGVQTLEHSGQERKQHYAIFVSTLPPESVVLRATRIPEQDSNNEVDSWDAWNGGSWEMANVPNENESVQDDIIRTEGTITACCWNDQYAVQITQKEARILHRPALLTKSSFSFSSALLGAATKANVPFIAASFRHGGQPVLEIVSIQDAGTFADKSKDHLRYDLPCDTTCIELLLFDKIPHVFVGLVDGSICLFEVGDQGSLTLGYSTRLGHDSGSGPPMVCESAVLLASGERQRLELVCGTRDGCIVSISFQSTGGRYDAVSKNVTKMGSAEVKVRPCATDTSTAFMACGPDFCRIRCSTSSLRKMDIDSIWLVDHDISAYTQSPITALDQIPFEKGTTYAGRDLGGFMFAVSGDRGLLAQLDYDVRWSIDHETPLASLEQSKAVPRKLPTSASPMKMSYLKKGSLHNIVVSTMENKEVRKPPDNGYRTVRSSLKFLKVNEELLDDEPLVRDRLVQWEFALKPYERVYSMVELIAKSGTGKKHHLIIVGTGIARGPGQEHGRRLFFNAGKPDTGGPKLKKALSHEHPVRCMGVLDDKHLVGTVGTSLRIWEFNHTTSQWDIRAKEKLPSMGVHLSVSGRFIHVSTAQDSHICYHVDAMEGNQFTVSQIFTDLRQRPSAHHLVCDLQRHVPTIDSTSTQDPTSQSTTRTDTLVILTDKACSVTGLFHQNIPTLKSATTTIFQASLPRSVIRIHRAAIRPPWRRPCPSEPSQPFAPLPGVLADDILGACSDGTIYSFSLLTETSRRLLRLLQNIIEAKQKRDPALQFSAVKPRSSDIFSLLQNGAEGAQDALLSARDVNPEFQELGEAGPRFNHVDGDMLVRFVESRGEVCVRKLVEEGCDQGVRTLLMERIKAVIDGEGGSSVRSEEEVFEWVEKWLGDVLMPIL